jgi:chromosomal replication initiation ATPase DnaA
MTPHQINYQVNRIARQIVRPCGCCKYKIEYDPLEVNPQAIIDVICRKLRVPIADVLANDHHRKPTEARYIIAYKLRNEYKMKLVNIAQCLNKSNHSTILYYLRMYKNLTDVKDESFLKLVERAG